MVFVCSGFTSSSYVLENMGSQTDFIILFKFLQNLFVDGICEAPNYTFAD